MSVPGTGCKAWLISKGVCVMRGCVGVIGCEDLCEAICEGVLMDMRGLSTLLWMCKTDVEERVIGVS